MGVGAKKHDGGIQGGPGWAGVRGGAAWNQAGLVARESSNRLAVRWGQTRDTVGWARRELLASRLLVSNARCSTRGRLESVGVRGGAQLVYRSSTGSVSRRVRVGGASAPLPRRLRPAAARLYRTAGSAAQTPWLRVPAGSAAQAPAEVTAAAMPTRLLPNFKRGHRFPLNGSTNYVTNYVYKYPLNAKLVVLGYD
ncbi:hypothetical protein T492DRAFT_361955 [Pavlovales sp. CCMP2436]|nr:hypothetical protein T492DRAFT_361955 [Pavlovales sp. CCMP2436]